MIFPAVFQFLFAVLNGFESMIFLLSEGGQTHCNIGQYNQRLEASKGRENKVIRVSFLPNFLTSMSPSVCGPNHFLCHPFSLSFSR